MIGDEIGRHLIGLLLTAIAFVPICAGSTALRRWLLPGWSGAPAALATFVLGLGLVVTVAEAMGSVGAFALFPMMIALPTAGALCWWLGSTRTRGQVDGEPTDLATDRKLGRGPEVLAVVSVVLVLAEWGERSARSYRDGMQTVDTLWYHMPLAASWVQDGSITSLYHFENEPLTTFFPANSPIFHGLGIMFLGSDVLSPALNLGWLALALLAGWCLGRPFGAAPLTLAATATVFLAPAAMGTQPGGAYSDTMGIFLLLASLALIATAGIDRRDLTTGAIAVAAVAAGLAAGTKLQFLIPVAAITLGAIALVPRGARVRHGALWLGVLAASGGFWYLRNLIRVGNPLPSLELDLGPLHLSGAPMQSQVSTMLDYLLDEHVWTTYFLPGFGQAFTWAWWVLFAVIIGAQVVGLLKGPLLRMLAFVGLVTFVSYIVSPAILGHPEPMWFVYTLRYLLGALVIGAVVSCIVATGSGRRWATVASAVVMLVLGATQVEAGIWPEPLELRFDEPIWARASLVPIAIVTLMAFVMIATYRCTRSAPRNRQLAVAAGIVIVLVAGSAALRQNYLDADSGSWATDLRDERIGIVNVVLQYPLYGADLSNQVRYIGSEGPHGGWTAITNCPAWRQAINDGGYSYVMVAPPGYPLGTASPPETAWTATDPAAALHLEAGGLSIFRITGPLDPGLCPTTAPGATP